ncbi:MAG TPA: hypothetical protein VN176_18980 [Verrucomicrobiae bacterium]|jgi:hypothetical protein|nr:hypothetical protein [Verrucomicrobiae bacterium]
MIPSKDHGKSSAACTEKTDATPATNAPESREEQIEAETNEDAPPAISSQRADCQKSLKTFIEHAWPILEPVQPLQWNWHLDLICEYLTLIRNNEFRSPGSEIEGIIFNVPPRTMKSLLISGPNCRYLFCARSTLLVVVVSPHRDPAIIPQP